MTPYCHADKVYFLKGLISEAAEKEMKTYMSYTSSVFHPEYRQERGLLYIKLKNNHARKSPATCPPFCFHVQKRLSLFPQTKLSICWGKRRILLTKRRHFARPFPFFCINPRSLYSSYVNWIKLFLKLVFLPIASPLFSTRSKCT